jgi:hypothetical protein
VLLLGLERPFFVSSIQQKHLHQQFPLSLDSNSGGVDGTLQWADLDA